MQTSNQAHVVQLPLLKDKCFCPVLALKTLFEKNSKGHESTGISIKYQTVMGAFDSPYVAFIFTVSDY